MVKFSLTKVNPSVDALAALWGLAEIRKQLPPIDAVELARTSRQDLEHRGVYEGGCRFFLVGCGEPHN